MSARPQEWKLEAQPTIHVRVNEFRTFLIKSYFLIFGCVLQLFEHLRMPLNSVS